MQLFHLFRLKAIESQQASLFPNGLSKAEFLINLISQKPYLEIRQGYVWHIGNIRQVGKDGLLFAIGRTTKSNKEKYDEHSGDFVQIYDEEAPFTYAICDLNLGIIAISPKSKLSPTIKGIAGSFEKLLNAQPYTHENDIHIEVAEIWDPEGFIQKIHEAYAVIGFTVSFSGPNPWDVEKDFHKPMEDYLAVTGGEKGKTSIQGADLNRVKLEIVTRSIASTGNDATARIKLSENRRPINKHMKGDPVSIVSEDDEIVENAEGLLKKLKEAYRRIRGHDEND